MDRDSLATWACMAPASPPALWSTAKVLGRAPFLVALRSLWDTLLSIEVGGSMFHGLPSVQMLMSSAYLGGPGSIPIWLVCIFTLLTGTGGAAAFAGSIKTGE